MPVGGLGLLPDDLWDPVHLTGLPGRVLKTWSSLPTAALVDLVDQHPNPRAMILRGRCVCQSVRSSRLLLSTNSRAPNRKELALYDRWTLIRRIVEWARGEYFGAPSAGPSRHFSRLLDRIGRVLVAQGAPGAILWIKRRRSEYLGYLASDPSSKQGRRFRNRLISQFGRSQARVLLKRRAPVIRMVLTALTSLRSLSLPVRVDLTTVTNPFTGTHLIP